MRKWGEGGEKKDGLDVQAGEREEVEAEELIGAASEELKAAETGGGGRRPGRDHTRTDRSEMERERERGSERERERERSVICYSSTRT